MGFKIKITLPLFSKLLLSGFTLCSSYAVLAEPCQKWNDDFNQKSGLSIGDISINAGNVFDLSLAKESRSIHRIANNFHISTKPEVIRRQLLFKHGDAFDLRKIEESQRLIRGSRYIQDVDISPTELCGTQVNIQVKTIDRWTLAPGVSFSHSGGNSKSGFEIQEHNLLGLGKGLVLGYKNLEERDETILAFTDTQFLGTRQQLLASIQNNSDGEGYAFDLSLPFFELDSRKSWGLSSSNILEENSLYEKGDVSDKIKVDKSEQSAFWGWSKGLVNDSVSRFKVGWNHSQTEYKQLYSRTESYPWFEYERSHQRYTTRTNFKSMGEIEDVALGTNYTLGVGLLRKEFGSTDNHINLNGTFNKGYEFNNSLAFINLGIDSYQGNGQLKGESLNLEAEWYSFNQRGSDVYLSGKFNYKNNLQADEQILLGGDSGLRGFPKGYLNGDKSIIVTAEKRFHFDWYPLNIAKFGAVIFTDVGSAWGDGKNIDVLVDAGIGLRMIPTRTSITKALHFDLAFPLNGDKDVDDYQLTIKTENTF